MLQIVKRHFLWSIEGLKESRYELNKDYDSEKIPKRSCWSSGIIIVSQNKKFQLHHRSAHPGLPLMSPKFQGSFLYVM